MRKEENKSCFPVGFCPPPRDSTVTNTASNWASNFGLSKRRTQRRLAALSNLKAPMLRDFIPRASTSPGLERAGSPYAWLFIQIESVEDERFSAGIKDAAKSLLRFAVTVNIKHISDVKLPGAH